MCIGKTPLRTDLGAVHPQLDIALKQVVQLATVIVFYATHVSVGKVLLALFYAVCLVAAQPIAPVLCAT
jgi:hypothetical protein